MKAASTWPLWILLFFLTFDRPATAGGVVLPPAGGLEAPQAVVRPSPTTGSGLEAPAAPPSTPLPGPELSPSARMAWAWRAFYDDALDPALAVFLELVREVPDRADAHYGAGRCLLARGELEPARARFEAAVARDPRDPEFRFYLGVVAYQLEEFSEAIYHWEAAAPLLDARTPGPLHRDHAWLLARAWLEAGDRARGERWFERALSLGGQGADGTLHPPPLELERTLQGRLPGARFMPVGGRRALPPGAAVVFSSGGAIWRFTGASPLRERLTTPPEGWRDSHPAREPGGDRLAFLSTDPVGRSFLFLQEGDGSRRRLFDRPVAPLRPAWTGDRAALVFVAPVEGSSQLRVSLLQLSSGDVSYASWPPGPAIDPHVSPAGDLWLAAEHDGRYVLTRTTPGATHGELLEPHLRRDLPERREGEGGEQGEGTEEGARQVEARLEAVRRREARSRPMYVGEPWSADELARNRTGVEAGGGTSARSGASGSSSSSAGRASSGGEQPVRIMGRPSPTEQALSPLIEKGPPEDAPAVAAAPNPGEREGDVRQPAVDRNREVGWIAYTRRQGGLRRIWAWSPGEGLERPISPAGKDCAAPDFSPDGRMMLFVCLEAGNSRLYLYDRVEGRSMPAYQEPLSVSGPAWIEEKR